MDELDIWTVVTLDIADDNPAEARRIWQECTYAEIATAFAYKRRKQEGVGYRVEID